MLKKKKRGAQLGSKNAATHGMSYTPTWNSWAAMRDRCLKKSHMHYGRYGGAGITICERWDKFQNFLADMGERPDGMSLDRIDSAGNYEPGNCRWATAKEQRANQKIKGRSRFFGVSWISQAQKWGAILRMPDGNQKVFGYHQTEDQAASAFNAAAIRHYGPDYPRLNKLD